MTTSRSYPGGRVEIVISHDDGRTMRDSGRNQDAVIADLARYATNAA